MLFLDVYPVPYSHQPKTCFLTQRAVTENNGDKNKDKFI